MKLNQVAAQIYTVRDFLKTPKDVSDSIKKLKEIGYSAVQVSGTQVDYKEIAKILSDEGVTCCATHENGELIINEPQKIVERLSILNCKITAFPHPGKLELESSPEKLKDFLKKLNAAGKVLHDAGMVLCYHNHANEFLKVEGKTIMDWIYDATDPKYVQGEPDTFWVQKGGGSPVAWCEKLKNRLPIIHLKDYKMKDRSEPTYCEIGEGNIDFKAVIAAADKSGCKWYAVEQDTCPGNPFDSLKKSFDYIKANLCVETRAKQLAV